MVQDYMLNHFSDETLTVTQCHEVTYLDHKSWWCHEMETFSALLALCPGNSPVTGEFPAQRPVTRSFDVFFNLHLNKRWSKQSWGWWFETPSCPLWCHCNENHKESSCWLLPHRSGCSVKGQHLLIQPQGRKCLGFKKLSVNQSVIGQVWNWFDPH